ncbi:MAG: hypothetical protein LBE38_01275 [Deltaproteobacteria bacterium]|nr:hypothetical protein [Deltaproteobacteria bacterium]
MSASELNKLKPWPEIFGRIAPLELEIGFGNGEYLHRKSLEEPHHDFVGLEISWPSIKRALRRLGNPKRDNVRLICLHAEPALSFYFAPSSIKIARCLFPVPWPREKNTPKRLFSRSFLDLLASRIQADGYFHLVTDEKGLAQWTLSESLSSNLPLELTECEAQLDTKYERKWEGMGQKIFYHLKGSPKTIHFLERTPKVLMQPLYINSLDPKSYNPKGITGDICVLFRGLTFDGEKGEALLNTKVVEGSYIQEFYIRFSLQADGRWKLYPSLSNQVFPTEGVQKALILAATVNDL